MTLHRFSTDKVSVSITQPSRLHILTTAAVYNSTSTLFNTVLPNKLKKKAAVFGHTTWQITDGIQFTKIGYKQDVRHPVYTQAQLQIARFEDQIEESFKVDYHLIRDVICWNYNIHLEFQVLDRMRNHQHDSNKWKHHGLKQFHFVSTCELTYLLRQFYSALTEEEQLNLLMNEEVLTTVGIDGEFFLYLLMHAVFSVVDHLLVCCTVRLCEDYIRESCQWVTKAVSFHPAAFPTACFIQSWPITMMEIHPIGKAFLLQCLWYFVTRSDSGWYYCKGGKSRADQWCLAEFGWHHTVLWSVHQSMYDHTDSKEA